MGRTDSDRRRPAPARHGSSREICTGAALLNETHINRKNKLGKRPKQVVLSTCAEDERPWPWSSIMLLARGRDSAWKSKACMRMLDKTSSASTSTPAYWLLAAQPGSSYLSVDLSTTVSKMGAGQSQNQGIGAIRTTITEWSA